jgi:enterobacterial common antigen flippase
VRQIADAAGTGDAARVARTAQVLRRVSWVCAGVGALVMVVLAAPLATLTFGDTRHANAIAWLSVAVALSVIAGSQSALLQGLRRIGDLARLNVFGAALGTLVGVPLVYFFGEQGLVPTLVVVAASALLSSWWYSSRLQLEATTVSASQTWQESQALLKLGLAFMASGLLTTGAAFLVRIIVLRHDGLEAAGIYQAAWTLGGLYIGFVLQAMGTDFYPRLVASVRDNAECNRLVNEQAQVSLLLATPGILFTLAAAPLAISLFYSTKFAGAVDTLRWICLGMGLRVLTWPIGFIVVAKNKQMVLFLTELAWAVVNVALTWWCVSRFGAVGAGLAFFGSYVFHGLMLYPIVKKMTGFGWSVANRQTAGACFSAIAAVFLGFVILPPQVALVWGVLVAVLSSWLALRAVQRLLSPDRMPKLFKFCLSKIKTKS